MSKKSLELISLIVILAIAAFFRLWQLDKIPPGLYPDVAMNGNDALNSLRSGDITAPQKLFHDFKVFYPDNNGREGLMMWLIALSFYLFGVSIWSIKIVAAVIGILTVLGLYLLTKELFRKVTENSSPAIALFSSFFLATSFWHTNFSRIGFRVILIPFILVFAFYFLFRGFRRKSFLDFAVSGIFFGLGFYTYISYRFVVLLLPLVFLSWLFIYKKEGQLKKFLIFTVLCLIFTVFVTLPLGIYFLKNPQDFIGRAAQVSIFDQEKPLFSFGKSLICHLGMFNFYGDQNWRHNFAGYPLLSFFAGLLFLIGFVFSIKKLISSIKNKDMGLVSIYCLLLSWFFIMLIPSILSTEGIPHALRTIGVIPSVCIFAALGGKLAYQFFDRNTEKKKLLVAASVLFILAAATFDFVKYFFFWAEHPRVKDSFTQGYFDMGNYLNSLSPQIKKYVIVNEFNSPLYGISIPAQTPIFIESIKFGKPRSIYIKAQELDQIEPGENGTVILPLYDGEILNELQKRFPDGKIKEKRDFTPLESLAPWTVGFKAPPFLTGFTIFEIK